MRPATDQGTGTTLADGSRRIGHLLLPSFSDKSSSALGRHDRRPAAYLEHVIEFRVGPCLPTVHPKHLQAAT